MGLHFSRTAIIVGATPHGLRLAEELRGYEILGFFDDEPCGDRWRGCFRDVAAFVREHQVDSVFLAFSAARERDLAQISFELADTMASVRLVPDLSAFSVFDARGGTLGAVPVITLRDTPLCGFQGSLKTILDYGIAAGFLFVLWPLMTLIALAVRLSSPGPIIFRQKRHGLNGHEIEIYKFRTMYEDGRVTKVGFWLRRTSLDELPQFLNILQGKLSLVGPRPHPKAENEVYRKRVMGYMWRHKVRPGLTGWAQIHGLSAQDDLEKDGVRTRFDQYYLQRWSLGFDLWIIFKTPGAILRRATR